jgi:hypothetical protein
MKRVSPVSNPEKPLTEAEKQIRRLEALRQVKEENTTESAQKAYLPPKTPVEKMTEKLIAMRAASGKTPGARRIKIDGKQKSSKLRFLQIRILEELYTEDKRLRGSVVTRIALNRFLNLDNTAEENELEARINEILRQHKNRG